MNAVINCASEKPPSPPRGYSYVHDSKLRQPCYFAATMSTTLLVAAAMAYGHLDFTVTGKPLGFPSNPV